MRLFDAEKLVKELNEVKDFAYNHEIYQEAHVVLDCIHMVNEQPTIEDVEKLKRENFGLKTKIKNLEEKLDRRDVGYGFRKW